MKKMTRKSSFVFAMLLVFSLLLQGMSAYAAAAKKPDLFVSANGKKFKLTNGSKSYSFRYDWNSKKKNYTGYSKKKAAGVASTRFITLGVQRDTATSHRNDSIVVLNGTTINKKIYGGMSLASFHKKIKSAWGKGHYGYWDEDQKKAVAIGTKRPSKSFVKKRCKSTGLYWTGKRGKLKISVQITWNAKKKRAETGWIEIIGSAATVS